MMCFKNRIRPGDVSLVFNYYRNIVMIAALLIMIPCNMNNLKMFLSKEATGETLSSFLVSLFVALSIGGLIAYAVYRLFPKKHKTLVHRELLANMIMENGWYTSENVQNDSFFKDIKSTSKKEKITEFPRMYYQFKNNMIFITVKITMGKYQDQLLRLEEKLETGLFCECTMKELKENYIEYTFLYNMLENRISIDDVECKDGKLKLMKNLWWDYDGMPHVLCIGGTGGGKTYFILTLIETFLKTNAELYILDPKRSDLADLSTILPNVYYHKEEMIACLQEFYDGMMNRTEDMKKLPNYKTGKNYAYCGLEPHFLIFDEYVAFVEMLDHRERETVLALLRKIVMLGRQMGYFLILACQRPDAKYLGDGIRDQFNFRVALGRNSELGYSMAFGDTDKEFFLKKIRGRGYLDSGEGVITEFYTPEVPPEHDFIREIERLWKERCERQPELKETKSETTETTVSNTAELMQMMKEGKCEIVDR